MKVSELLSQVYNGTIVLPDFQRSFIWEPEDVRELLVSVLGGYFIGSMLVLECLRDESPFALRLIEGVEKVNKSAQIQSIVKILLDGQQRTSALFYALYEPNMPLKNRKNPYRFYIDLDKALKGEWNDAVIAISVKDKKTLSEIKNNPNIIPFSDFRDIEKAIEKYEDHPRLSGIIQLVNKFLNREIHIVSLPGETDLERIVETFERINRTGEPLSIFELLTAKLYKDGIKLRDLWENAKENYDFAEFVSPEFVLKVIALLRGKEPKRKNILELSSEDFAKDWERACGALEAAYKRTIDIKNGYGVLEFKKWMPYTTMLVPLAAVIDFIEADKKDKKANKLNTASNYDKIDRWYWTSVFSNRYDQAADTKSKHDFDALKDWINDDNKVPDFIQKFNFNSIDLDTDKQSSAIYRGVISMIVLQGALDFKTGQPPQFDKGKIQDDHIFPKSVFKEHSNINDIANRTLISTNVEKSNKKPSEYFNELLAKHGKKKLLKILKSHLIPEDALDDLLKDDFQNFVKKRKQAIINNLHELIKV